MTASQIASRLAKCLNSAPCVTPTSRAMSPVVMAAGLLRPASVDGGRHDQRLAFFGGQPGGRRVQAWQAFGNSSITN